MLRTWVFEFFPELSDEDAAASGKSVAEYFEDYLTLWARAETLGFDGIFFSEHHFGGSFSPSPNLLIAATAARTKSIRLGVMGVVAPYYTAARIVEEIGILDQMSAGRLEIGTAVGVPQELAKVGLSMEQAREIYNEAVEILDLALETGVVTYSGKHFKYENLRLLPRPAQKPCPPKWSTVVSPDSARRAAQRRSKICTGFTATDAVAELFRAYLDEAKSLGLGYGSESLGLRRRVIVAETETAASEMSQSAAERYRSFVANDPRMKFSHIPDAPQKGGGGGFSVSDDEFISGTPAQVTEQIVDQCRRSGAGNFLAVLHWGAGLEEVRSAHELFGKKVLPALKSAGL